MSNGDEIISEKVGYLTSIKNLKLDLPEFNFNVNVMGDYYEIILESKNFIKNLFVSSSSDYNFSDNYFDLLPGHDHLYQNYH